MAQHLSHFRKEYTFLFASGAAGAGLIQTKPIDCAGEILNIRQTNKTNTNAVTAKAEVVDKHGRTVFDGTALAHNAVHNLEFVTLRRVLDGEDTLRVTISGDPGATGAQIDITISVYGRDA